MMARPREASRWFPGLPTIVETTPSVCAREWQGGKHIGN